MGLTLYGAILSPYVRKIRIQLAEQNIDYELTPVAPFQQPDWYYAISPLGRIPAIKDGDFTLADSAVIAQYLQDTRKAASLYGDTAEEAARVRWLEKYADYELAPYSTFTVFYNRVVAPVKGETSNTAAVEAALTTQLPPLFDYLEAELANQPFFLGSRLSLADIAVSCQLINMTHAGEWVDAQRWPGLAGLLGRMIERASVALLLPEEQKLVARMTGKA